MKIRWIISAVLIAVAVVGISFADTWMKDTGYEINGTTLDFDIWQQLHNIGTTTISSTQWGYLGNMNQGVSTSDAPTFATINTGQGANEVYAMNQNVQTTDSPTFAGITLTDTITGLNYTINANSLQQDLVGYWGFEYGSGGTAYDSSREGNDGTLTNMDNSTCWVAGKDGTALEFDGADDYVDIGSGYNLSSATISFWFNQPELWRQSTVSSNYRDFDIRFWEIGGDINIYKSDGSGGYDEQLFQFNRVADEWQFATITYNEGEIKVYRNGVLIDSGSMANTSIYTDNVVIGGAGGDVSNFNGSIDDVRIYNRTLSEEEIRALYLGLGSQPTGHLALK